MTTWANACVRAVSQCAGGWLQLPRSRQLVLLLHDICVQHLSMRDVVRMYRNHYQFARQQCQPAPGCPFREYDVGCNVL
jgi:hypothetical protein